ncbi:hypothetical protein SB783_42440, partial [Paraburkholderia sp. SIMBA_009]
ALHPSKWGLELLGWVLVSDTEMTLVFGCRSWSRNLMKIKISRGLVFFWIFFWSMSMIYMIFRIPRDVVGISEKMSDLVNLVKLENGAVLSEDRFV